MLSVFDLGQIGIVLMALVLADTLPRSTRLPRGVLVGVATAIKLLPGVFVLVLGGHEALACGGDRVATTVGLWGVTALLRPGIVAHLLVPRSRSIRNGRATPATCSTNR